MGKRFKHNWSGTIKKGNLGHLLYLIQISDFLKSPGEFRGLKRKAWWEITWWDMLRLKISLFWVKLKSKLKRRVNLPEMEDEEEE